MLGHVPLGIWYLVEVYSKGTMTLRDWLFAAVYIGCFIVIGMTKIGHTLLAHKDSPYPFAADEMERFDPQGHLARIRSEGTPG